MTKNTLYQDKHRPQFHFTAENNWLNDPNGCVYHDGEYHLFFQHNPSGVEHGNMTWGHAVSSNLIHWEQLEHALLPYDNGTIFSGSAVVDSNNLTELGEESKGPLVAAFTHAKKPFGQAIAFSNDNGRKWEFFDEGRHVIPNQRMDEGERDPKIFWHQPSLKWVMVLWVKHNQVRFFNSYDLLTWSHVSDFTGEEFFECPDLIQLMVDGDSDNPKWVLYDAAFNYWIGSFNGEEFRCEEGPYQGDLGNNFYAAQTWNNVEDRIIQIGWMRGGKYPEMPFNQQMSFPCELTLRNTQQGIRLYRMPVNEITDLYIGSESIENFTVESQTPFETDDKGNLLDVEIEMAIPKDSSFTISISGQEITYSEERIECLGKQADLPSKKGLLSLRILVDRTSIEIFGNGGQLSMSSCFLTPDNNEKFLISTEKSAIDIRNLTIHRLKSAWRKE